MGGLLKIVLTGPESSGKSLLGRSLADFFNARYIPEYARIHLESEGPDYDYEALQELSKLHLDYQNKNLRQGEGLFFLDTDLINYLVWQKLVYGKHDPWLDKMIAEEADHRYLITAPDIPWEPDPLRENPSDRERIFEAHLQEIEKLKRNYRVVRGTGEERFTNAVAAVRSLLQGQ